MSTMQSKLDAIKGTFFEESRDLLDLMEISLLSLEKQMDDEELMRDTKELASKEGISINM